MRKLFTAGALIGMALAAPVALQAQAGPFSVEARAGVAFPTGDFGDGLETGFGFGASAAYRVLPMLDVFAGYSWHRFSAEDDPDFADASLDVTDSGFALGARFNVMEMAGITPWVQAGLLLHQLEFSGTAEGISASITSDRGFGFEVGGGLAISLAPNIAMTPGLRYRQYNADFDLGEFGSDSGDVKYVALDLGVQIRF